jgi:diadenylate cyclase
MYTFHSLVTNFRWQDIIDILVVGYFLFRLYVLFRGTYVFRVIIGIGFLWIFQRVAASLGLIVTSWAMQGIIAFAAITIIVVFRNEIKNVLQTKDLGAILWGFSHKAYQTPVDIITESVYELANKKIGALMVLPAKDDLQELVQSGIPWRGVLSKEMILSVFWPDNPAHDGAAIISGNKIMEVGVILPLSRRSDLPSIYGTRHRAAIGLSEKTDSLVIVVSEETGHVITVKKGEIKEINTNIELEKTLQDHMGISYVEKGIREKEYLQLSIAAVAILIFVTGTWFSFSRGLETFISMNVPIEYMNRNPGMELLESSINTVNLSMSGAGPLIKSIKPDQVKVRIDLDKSVIGLNSYTITQENITLPPGVLLKKVDPNVIDVTLDVPVKKKLPVQVDWIGKLSPDLILEEIKMNPKQISVVGGSKILEQISTIYTERVTLDGLKESGEMVIKLALNPASLKVDSDSKDKLVLSYTIRKRG